MVKYLSKKFVNGCFYACYNLCLESYADGLMHLFIDENTFFCMITSKGIVFLLSNLDNLKKIVEGWISKSNSKGGMFMENKIEYKTLYSYKNKSETLLNNSIEVLIEDIIAGGKVVGNLIDNEKIKAEKEIIYLLSAIRELNLCNNIKKQLDEVLDSEKCEVDFFK